MFSFCDRLMFLGHWRSNRCAVGRALLQVVKRVDHTCIVRDLISAI